MHKYSNSNASPQKGVALVLSLIILVVLTVLGVATMSGVNLQERMSANTKLQTYAFEAASGGIARALEFGINPDNWDSSNSCNRGQEWDTGWSSAFSFQTTSGVTSSYRLRIRCLEDFEPSDIDADLFDSLPPQLFLVSEGRVESADGDLLAVRQIEVRIEDVSGAGRAESAIRVEGEPSVTIDPANSDVFTVDGKGGAAISASTTGNADIIFDAVEEVDRVSNYRGGIIQSDYESPWNDPADLADFINAISDFMETEGNVDGHCGLMNLVDGDFTVRGNTAFDGLTYVRGDLDMRGNPSGGGVVIVEGDVEWRGTAEFTGLVIGLGGSFSMRGGGRGDTSGSMFFTNLDLDSSPTSFGSTNLDFSGGGNHTISFDCEAYEDALTCLDKIAGPDVVSPPDCSAEQSGTLLGRRLAVASWRENLGWREDDLVEPEPGDDQ